MTVPDRLQEIFFEISGGDDVISKDDLRKWFLKEKLQIDFREIWDIAAQADNEEDGITFDEFEIAVEDLAVSEFCLILMKDYTFWLIFPALIAPFWGITVILLELGPVGQIVQQILTGFAAVALIVIQMYNIQKESRLKHIVYEELTGDLGPI